MDEARSRLEAGVSPPFAITARQQTGGRGRRGARWHSPTGGVWLTAVIEEPPAPPPFAVLVPLAVRDAIIEACGVEPERLEVKWPNDLLLDGKKVSGTLCERTHDGVLLVGIGVNADFEAPLLELDAGIPATTLRSSLTKRVNPTLMSESIFQRLQSVRTIEELNGCLAYRGDRVGGVQPDGTRVEGEVLGVASDGALRLLVGGQERHILSGAIHNVRAT